MSTFDLANKLHPATKARKSFKTRFRSKLRLPKFANTIINTLRQHCMVAWRSIYPYIHRNFLALTKRPRPRSHRGWRHINPSFSAILVDELFPGPVPLAEQPRKHKEIMDETRKLDSSVDKYRIESTTWTHNGEKIQIRDADKVTAKNPVVDEKGLGTWKGKAKAGESSKSCDHKWKVPMIPQFRGVDERAEEFIAKFRQDMKLEREQSILEFQEMLKRSA